MYRSGGFLVLAVVVALLIAMATHPASPTGRMARHAALAVRRAALVRPVPVALADLHGHAARSSTCPSTGCRCSSLRLALTFGIAELSFRFVEMPIRRGAIDRWVKAWRASRGAERTRRTRRGVTVLATALAGVLVVGLALSTAPAPSAAAGLAPDVAEALGIADGGPTEVSLDDEPSDAASASASAEPGPAGPSAPAARNPNGNLSAIGDSVMLGARTVLKETIPGTKVDAAVSRFPGAFIGRLKKYVARDKLADVVVLHPGTNGVLPEDMMREMLDILKDTPTVVVVNDNMPRSWRTPNNEVIDNVVPDYPNAVIADWYAASKDHPEYFVSDGIHLTAKGARAYAKLIKTSAGL